MPTKTTTTKARSVKKPKYVNPCEVSNEALDKLMTAVQAEDGIGNAIEVASRLKEMTFDKLLRLHLATIWANLKHCHDTTDLGAIARSFRDLACEIDGRGLSFVEGYSRKTENHELEMAIGLIDFTTDGERRQIA